MDAIGLALQLHDRRPIHHAIQQCHREGRVAQILGPVAEVDIGDQDRGMRVQDSVCEILFGTLFGGGDFHNCRRAPAGDPYPAFPGCHAFHETSTRSLGSDRQ